MEKDEEVEDHLEYKGTSSNLVIKIPAGLLKKVREPWQKCLIVRILGKNIGYKLFVNRMRKLWNPQADFETLDIGHGFFIVKFEMMEDYSKVYMGGPWVMMDRYVTVRKWQADFKSDEAEEDTTAIWVRFPNLPIEYYDEKVLYHISKALGKPLKIDINTAMAARGKYARVCIEMDLRKPLISHITIGRYHYIVEYEHLHLLCFSCGRVGHRKEKCFEFPVMQPEKTTQNVTVSQSDTDTGPGTSKPTGPKMKEVCTEAETGGYGPWTLVTTKRKFQQGKLKQKAHSYKSNRFAGLQMDQDQGETSGDPKISEAQEKYVDLDLEPQPISTQTAQVMDMDLPKTMENVSPHLGRDLQAGPRDTRGKHHANQHPNTHDEPKPSPGEQLNTENPNTLPTVVLSNASSNTITKTAIIVQDNRLKSRKGKPPDLRGRQEARTNGGNRREHSDGRTSSGPVQSTDILRTRERRLSPRRNRLVARRGEASDTTMVGDRFAQCETYGACETNEAIEG
ncbi:hypothetical protein ACSBR2_026279 [Camellia fascicularis]